MSKDPRGDSPQKRTTADENAGESLANSLAAATDQDLTELNEEAEESKD